jgi:hypothetical protein
MADTRIAGVSLGGILVIAGLVLAILLSHWWIGLIILLVGLVFFGGFAKGSGTDRRRTGSRDRVVL